MACMGVLSTGVYRMLVGKRVDLSLTRSTNRLLSMHVMRPHGSESPVAGTGHSGLLSGWRVKPNHKPNTCAASGVRIIT